MAFFAGKANQLQEEQVTAKEFMSIIHLAFSPQGTWAAFRHPALNIKIIKS
jgi:hypothetical protein